MELSPCWALVASRSLGDTMPARWPCWALGAHQCVSVFRRRVILHSRRHGPDPGPPALNQEATLGYLGTPISPALGGHRSLRSSSVTGPFFRQWATGTLGSGNWVQGSQLFPGTAAFCLPLVPPRCLRSWGPGLCSSCPLPIALPRRHHSHLSSPWPEAQAFGCPSNPDTRVIVTIAEGEALSPGLLSPCSLRFTPPLGSALPAEKSGSRASQGRRAPLSAVVDRGP